MYQHYQPIIGETKTVRNINNANFMQHHHFHDGYEIHFTISDNVQFSINDNLFWAPKGTVFIINPHTPHRTIVPDGVWFERYVLHITPSLIEEINTHTNYDLYDLFRTDHPKDISHITLNEEGILNFEKLLYRHMHYNNMECYGSDVFQKLTLSEILFYLLRMKKDGVYHLASKVKDVNYKMAKNIIAFINSHLDSELNQDIIAEEFFRSKSTINRIFKKYTGTTVSQYITSRRIYKACNLLKRNIPVFTVCEQCGFRDYNHFIRTFKRLIGVTPKQYTLKYIDETI